MQNEGLSATEKRVLSLKLEFMREWTAMFFNQQHRSVMNVLSAMRLDGIQKFDLNTPGHFFKEIVDIEDILNDLQHGKLILMEQCRLAKKGKKNIMLHIDFNFFNNCQNLMRDILESIQPKFENFKNIQEGEKRLICQNCRTERTETQVVFMQLSCNCTNTEFVPVEINNRERQRLTFIKEKLQTRFSDKKIEIDDLEKKVIYESQREKAREENSSNKQFEQFSKRYDLQPMKLERMNRSSNIERKRAQYLFGRHQTFNSVRQLKLINQLRKANKKELPQQPHNMGRND